MEPNSVYDLLGIGIGPFNLGLAALCYNIPELNCQFIDENESFNWHEGMLLSWARLQVPFYADLVSFADPSNKLSYLYYLRKTKGFIRFGCHENFFPKRTEYNEYCKWVAEQLPSLHFNSKCRSIHSDENNKWYIVKTETGEYYAKHIVIGVGTSPFIPSFAREINNEFVFHSSHYLYRKEKLLQQKRITIIGSGQSAAEIFYDLLQCYHGELYWFTRSEFSPMDYSKFALEKTSPRYIDHYYSLRADIKSNVLSQQDHLYKGINHSLIEAIYSMLCDTDSDKVHLHPKCEWLGIDEAMNLSFYHTELQKQFSIYSDAVIMATGYHNVTPDFLLPIHDRIQWNDKQYNLNRNYSIDNNNTIFVQNAELHSHGFNSADLGMGPYRNMIILNSILGYDYFDIEDGDCFQNFGLPIDQRPYVKEQRQDA